MTKILNAWIAVDDGIDTDPRLAGYTLALKGSRSSYQAIEEDDWILIMDTVAHITRVGRVLRIRSDLDRTMLYFDRLSIVAPAVSLDLTALTPPASGSVGRVQWADF